MAEHVDIGFGILRQHARDVVERGLELGLHIGAVIAEGDAGGHAQQQIVAVANHVDARAGGFFAQLAFLGIHIGAHARARDGANASAQNLFGPVIAPADQIAQQIAAQRAADAADRSLGNGALTGVGIGRAGGGGQHRGQACRADDAVRNLHDPEPLSFLNLVLAPV